MGMMNMTVKIRTNDPERVVGDIISRARAEKDVTFSVVEVRDGVAHVVLTGSADPLTRVYNWGVADRVW